jgi:hypothetical protein
MNNYDRRDLIGLNTILTVVGLIVIGILVGIINTQATALALRPAPAVQCVCLPDITAPGFNASDAANAVLMTGAR